MLKKYGRLAIAFLLAAAVAPPAFSQILTLKLASFAPVNSPWELGLKSLAADFDRISDGRVRLVFPQSLRASRESDIIQKMRLGVDGALLSTMGLAELYPDALALSMPSLIRNDAELDAVFKSIAPVVRDKLAERYAVLAIAKGGWIRYFSASPIVYPRDLRKSRISTSPDDEKIASLLQSMGARTVKGGLSALVLQLNSNAVDSFYLSPILAAMLWSQLHGRIGYMSPFKVAPFFGAIVFSKPSWDRVPADLKPRLEEAVRAMAAKTAAETERLEEASIVSLQKSGLQVPAYPDEADAAWSLAYAGLRDGLVAGMFSRDFLEIIDASLANVRKVRGIASTR